MQGEYEGDKMQMNCPKGFRGRLNRNRSVGLSTEILENDLSEKKPTLLKDARNLRSEFDLRKVSTDVSELVPVAS